MKQVELYDKVKPYSVDNEIKRWIGHVPRSNYQNSAVEDVLVKDLRGREAQFTFEKNGFAIIELDSAMTYEDFDDPVKFSGIYLQEVAACLLQYFDATSVHIFNTVRRRRHPDFPNVAVLRPGVATQPAARVHIDSTRESLDQLVRELQDDELSIDGRRYIYLNVWKPLTGPVHDWPLAFCDAQTIESKDLEPHDQVFHDVVRENVMVYHNTNQEWYYLSGQMPSELLLFRQADSQNNPGVAHTAFRIPTEPLRPIKTRESIEVRVVVFLD